MFLLFASDVHGLTTQIVTFIALAIFAALIGELFVRWGQSNIVGIMIVAILVGNIFGITEWANEPIISFLAMMGAVVILFYAGLESDLEELRSKIISGLAVAVVGVVVPLLLVVTTMKFIYGASWIVSLLVANVLVATSVAVTVSVFSQNDAQKTKIADIILVAAVIDDILGMLLLGIIEPIISNNTESLSIFKTITQVTSAVGFISLGVFVGPKIAPYLSKKADQWFHSGNKGKLLFACLFCLVFVLIAMSIGLAPIIGAFTAGLILDHTHFKEFTKASAEDVEELIKPIRNIMLPCFFFVAGISVNWSHILNTTSGALVCLLLVLAIIGKVVSGFVIKPHGTRFGVSNLIIGLAMTPRGEVGMVIALMGKQYNIFDDQLYAILVMVIFLTTLLPPIPLNTLIRKYKYSQ